MPHGGVPAALELRAQYANGLKDIELNTHIWVLGWLEGAERSTLFSRSGRGVFGSRAPNRPNPIGLTVCRLLGRDGDSLQVGGLDFFDGTPVIDIKRYSPSWDCVFSASSPWELEPHDLPESEVIEDFHHQAVNFHGEPCPFTALAARVVYRAVSVFACGPRSPDLTMQVPIDGCLVDAFQGITGATLGSGRLRFGKVVEVHHRYLGTLVFDVAATLPPTDEVLTCHEEGLFRWERRP
jgi:tRNA-Thr(GGU) m(6)t(6)A37 methyltransferase TsaA